MTRAREDAVKLSRVLKKNGIKFDELVGHNSEEAYSAGAAYDRHELITFGAILAVAPFLVFVRYLTEPLGLGTPAIGGKLMEMMTTRAALALLISIVGGAVVTFVWSEACHWLNRKNYTDPEHSIRHRALSFTFGVLERSLITTFVIGSQWPQVRSPGHGLSASH